MPMTDLRTGGVPEGIDQVWNALGELRGSAVVAEARAWADAEAGKVARQRRFWRRLLPLSAGGLALAAACAAVFMITDQTDPAAQPVLYSTRVGEIRQEKLADGSVIVLDTNTRIEVAYTAQKRQLTLLSGQGHFDVAHNTQRPFVVSFGKNSVTAVGTSFDVAAFPGANAVTLLTGRVIVAAKPRNSGPAREVTLAPGQQVAIAGNGQLSRPRSVDTGAISAWQQGQLDLSDMPVSDALALMNRYSARKIVVKDPGVLDNKISGIFKAGDTQSAVDALSAYFGLRIAAQSPDEIVLTK